MRTLTRAACTIYACFFLFVENAAGQSGNFGCGSGQSSGASLTFHCDNGITIVAENGAKFELKDRNRDGHVDAVELSSKALLVEVPKKPGGNRFEVVTPQAIAAVRGTKWAVDAGDGKTSVFVVDGHVSVGRAAGGRHVVLGSGEGVDVEATSALVVKRWAPARAAALLARLGQ